MYFRVTMERKNIILFDGVCNLCNATVRLLIKHDVHNQLHFAAQQSDAGMNILRTYNVIVENDTLSDKNSVILIKEGQIFYKSDAVIQVSKLITGWPSMIQYTAILPKGFRDIIYDLVAKYRYKIFGKSSTCSVPTPANKYKFI